MDKCLRDWFKANKINLISMGIETENIRESPENCSDPSLTLEQVSKSCLGQISVWQSGMMDLEILDIETGSRLLYEHHELDGDVDFNSVLKNYFEIMRKEKA